jgi:translation initiation factor 5B
VLGHVDHGKTTLLDKIRGSLVVAKEPGLITQHIGATEIPIKTVKDICGDLLEKLKIKIEIPGLLFIDTPGHEAFTSLRKRGGSIADLAILIIDINEGFKPQTDESLQFLKEFKTPFLIAATKIDRIKGWNKNEDSCFLESYDKQPDFVKELFDGEFYKLIGQLSERGFETERFDKIKNFKENIAIVPCSGITGEGIPELLMILAGLSQQFLKKELEITKGIGRGSILEVKEVKGLGMTIDVILYDGEMKKGDWLIIGGKEPITTKIKALLKPPVLKEIRIEKQFDSINEVNAAAGIKISAPNLEGAIAGNPIASVHKEEDIEKVKDELKGASEIEFEKIGDGVILKADTLGSLEALINILKNIDIKKAEVGNVLKKDVIEMESVQDPLKRTILAFNVNVDEAAEKEAEDKKVKVLQSDIIYKLIENYEEFIEKTREEIRLEKLKSITRPAKLLILKGMTFRASNPAIVGVEVLEGFLKSGVKLQRDGKEIGTVKALQSDNISVESAKKEDRVAVSIDGPTVGRQIKERDELTVIINKNDLKVLEELDIKEEVELAKEILGLK